jgi:hypothetical protein
MEFNDWALQKDSQQHGMCRGMPIPGSYWMGSWVGSSAGLDTAVAKEENHISIPGSLARSQSLC